MKEKRVAFGFWLLALGCLLPGLLFGMGGALQYLLPDFLKQQLSFASMRPLHVFLITQWIICAALGCMYYFLPMAAARRLFSPRLAQIHLYIQLMVIAVAVSDFFLGSFSGREYLEFPVWVIFVMIGGFVLALINFIATVRPKYNTAPVYIWSWTTGLVFFIITLSEAALWQMDHFNYNIIRDITVQWKALGSMVGAWNMLIYGAAIYVMCRISGSDAMARSPQAFFFYFLGLTNLMFNWGHHTYVVPAAPLIRNTAYIISMTELLILFNMIYQWRQSLKKCDTPQHASYRLLKMTDKWIMLNLVLAIAISVPAINYFTHGTHITVAHAMGATIGINTTILLAAGFYMHFHAQQTSACHFNNKMKQSVWLFNFSLLVFWLSLIGSGVVKAVGTSSNQGFYQVMQQLQPWFRVFTLSGFVLMIAITLLATPLIRSFWRQLVPRRPIPQEVYQLQQARKKATVLEDEV